MSSTPGKILILVHMTMAGFILASMLQVLFILISRKEKKNLAKESPFECGFFSFSRAQMPITIQFFVLGLIFLIFDMEIILLFPSLYQWFSREIVWSMLFFLCFMSLSLLMEWKQFMLEWIK